MGGKRDNKGGRRVKSNNKVEVTERSRRNVLKKKKVVKLQRGWKVEEEVSLVAV